MVGKRKIDLLVFCARRFFQSSLPSMAWLSILCPASTSLSTGTTASTRCCLSFGCFEWFSCSDNPTALSTPITRGYVPPKPGMIPVESRKSINLLCRSDEFQRVPSLLSTTQSQSVDGGNGWKGKSSHASDFITVGEPSPCSSLCGKRSKPTSAPNESTLADRTTDQ